MKSIIQTGAVALFAAALLASTAAGAKTLVYCSEGSPENFTPAMNTTGTSFDAARPVFDQLTEFVPGTTEIEPGLAEKWDVSADGKTFTFHLRKGVKFHSGVNGFKPTRDFNADDVLFTFNRQWKDDHPYHKISGGKFDYFSDMDMTTSLESVEKTDDYTVVMKLKAPNAPILANLAMDFMTVQSAEYADYLLKAGKPEQFDQIPVGTGPFQFVNYQKDAVIRYKAFPQYWRGKAKLDDLVYAITPDPTVRLAKLEKNECQVMIAPRPADLAELKKNADVNLLSQPGLNIAYWSFNVTKPPMDKLEVRQALTMAVDKDAIMKEVYQGAGEAAKNLIPPIMWGYNKDIVDYKYDPAKSKELLEKAGVRTPIDIELWWMPVQRPYNPNAKRIGELMQADLAKIGVNATLKSYEWGEYRKRLQAGEAQTAEFGWTGDNGDPDNFFFFLGCSDGKPAGQNAAKWCDAKFNEDLLKARGLADQGERAKIYQEMQQIAHDQLPVMNIAHSVVFEPIRKNVVGYKISPLGSHYFYNTDLN